MSKNVLLGVSGSIAAYKAAELASTLIKRGHCVKVIMTENAAKFVTPLTFQTITGNEVSVDGFAPVEHFDVQHISLVKWADLAVIAPATANVIAKIACGIADDLLTTFMLAFPREKRRFIAPAMNTGMYENAAVQDNLKLLEKRGFEIMEPREARLACGDTGKGAMMKTADILKRIEASAL
ncbi:MAG: hypothetical protein LBL34_01270 [Clostridiales bacterium]|jgi:phosphopantothenoylcysteine decarboxylase/phosphopantothenate--cysteine ligase|nr:hypothetical protein [Clostridiales bacterium]